MIELLVLLERTSALDAANQRNKEPMTATREFLGDKQE